MFNNVKIVYIEDVFIKFYSEFQQYMYTNNIIISASGYVIGFLTFTFISDLFSKIIMPLLISIMAIFYSMLITNILMNNLGIILTKMSF